MSAEEATFHHEDGEWDDQRENFTQYYKTENKTLKEAARCMVDNHQFHATPRQWERKVKAWGLEKYASRHDRLKQIESQGRSIHEVARVGRRPRTYDPGLLHPEHGDDRNIRRFARRELGRSGSNSRSRSRSNSFGNRSRSASPMLEASDEVIQEDIFALDFSPVLQSGSMHANAGAGPIHVPAVPTDHDSFNAQAHVLQIHDNITGETSDELFLSLPEQGAAQDMMQDVESLGHGHYDFADLDRRFSMDPQDAIPAQQHDVDAPSQFPPLDTSFHGSTDFMSSQTVAMQDISPTVSRPHNAAWIPPATFSPVEALPSANFLPEVMAHHQSYHATPTSDTGPQPDFPTGIAISAPDITVPELIFSTSPSPSHRSASTSGGHHQHSHQSSQSISHRDQQIYADFYASVNQFSQAVIDVVGSSAASGKDGTDGPGLKKLAEDLTIERKRLILHNRLAS